MIIQVGNSGGPFVEMSVINDTQLAECMIGLLTTGRRAKVSYEQSVVYNPLVQGSSYQILKVEPIQAGFQQ